jgi:predicted short-subunit dehydrogenase-like oxidoreductase (DUF2520 family)
VETRRFTLIGPGRAGSSFRIALEGLGWQCSRIYRRGDDLADAGLDVDLVLLAAPDSVLQEVAALIEPTEAVIMHVSGATPLSSLGGHLRTGALHPLASLATPASGAQILRTTYFAVAGDPLAMELADQLSGNWFPIADDDRALYHGAAAVASNHVVGLLGQVERICAEIGVPFEAFLGLVQTSLDNTGSLGPSEALTGPAARGDEATIEHHRRALAERLPDELDGYDAVLEMVRRLVR